MVSVYVALYIHGLVTMDQIPTANNTKSKVEAALTALGIPF